jgi:hypothetical protein
MERLRRSVASDGNGFRLFSGLLRSDVGDDAEESAAPEERCLLGVMLERRFVFATDSLTIADVACSHGPLPQVVGVLPGRSVGMPVVRTAPSRAGRPVVERIGRARGGSG